MKPPLRTGSPDDFQTPPQCASSPPSLSKGRLDYLGAGAGKEESLASVIRYLRVQRYRIGHLARAGLFDMGAGNEMGLHRHEPALQVKARVLGTVLQVWETLRSFASAYDIRNEETTRAFRRAWRRGHFFRQTHQLRDTPSGRKEFGVVCDSLVYTWFEYRKTAHVC